MKHSYPAKFTHEPEGGYMVTFRDLPEAITYGKTQQDAETMAADVLLCSLEARLENGERIPVPSAVDDGEQVVCAEC